jgi:hypothetical protein
MCECDSPFSVIAPPKFKYTFASRDLIGRYKFIGLEGRRNFI